MWIVLVSDALCWSKGRVLFDFVRRQNLGVILRVGFDFREPANQ